MKRFAAAFLAVCFCCLTVGSTAAAAGEPSVSAASSILVDAHSGRILFARNANDERAIASITKLMTALVAVESATDLDRIVTIKREYTQTEGSSMYLATDEQLTLKTLLYGLLLVSGNDAALAIAGSCAGKVDTFVDWMNEKAAELKMTHTHFVNPSGLPAEGHYSTAADMARLAKAVMENEELAKIVSTKSITLGNRTLVNHNKLLWQYEGCVGMKTGYTDAAGRTLVSCAQRDGQRLIVVTLGDPNDWRDHAALFDYGFSQWPAFMLALGGRDFQTIPVTGSLTRLVPVRTESDVYYPLSAGEKVTAKVELPQSAVAPVEEGSIAGSLTFYLDEQPIGSTYLVYARTVRSNETQSRGLIDRILGFFRREERLSLTAALSPVVGLRCSARTADDNT